MPNRLTRGRALVGALSIDAQKVTAGDAIVVGSLTAGTADVTGNGTVGGNLVVTGDVVASTVSASFTFANQAASIAAPTGGDTQDAQARTAIGSIIAALEQVGVLDASS